MHKALGLAWPLAGRSHSACTSCPAAAPQPHTIQIHMARPHRTTPASLMSSLGTWLTPWRGGPATSSTRRCVGGCGRGREILQCSYGNSSGPAAEGTKPRLHAAASQPAPATHNLLTLHTTCSRFHPMTRTRDTHSTRSQDFYKNVVLEKLNPGGIFITQSGPAGILSCTEVSTT